MKIHRLRIEHRQPHTLRLRVERQLIRVLAQRFGVQEEMVLPLTPGRILRSNSLETRPTLGDTALGYTALGLAIVYWRVAAAERAGLGGG